MVASDDGNLLLVDGIVSHSKLGQTSKGKVMKGAIYVEDSKNTKLLGSKNTKLLGSKKVDSTYTAIKQSCPNTCALKDEGCYAQTSFVGMVNYRNERRAKGQNPLQVA